ncbi:MAG: 1-acyl-sn-glycerol-3-phosphate acyltransferase [Chitinophagales bacterium]|nr:1-acyl-sn-glycerol-3-phosphate acyltransferase [Chitinophagales bacterium]
MKTLLKIFFTVWAAIAFMFWIVIAYVAYQLLRLFYGGKKDRQFLLFLYHFIGRMVVLFAFLRVKKVYHSSYNAKESYVVVSNHSTMMDIPANVVASPPEIVFKFLGKKEANRIPFFGYLIDRLCILVDRASEESRKSSYARMKAEMDKSYSIILYPEGTRNRTKEPIKEFYDGAFRLAIEMQKPLVVNTLVGIKELNPPTGFFTYRPGTVESHWDEAIITKGMTLEDIPQLKKRAGDIMIKRLLKHS